ncbi:MULTISPECIES: hypothetical protein [unclassified Legionella]|uniref:hypothetical protein n=1 Tax=unclassified Legionella TaxID=2622702 RepID=UPI0010569E21|nr:MULTISPECIES: hypothetical protein [unclassified Legionella]MDI9818715.1 hypothetical protein [Legionella sp. PL877]
MSVGVKHQQRYKDLLHGPLGVGTGIVAGLSYLLIACYFLQPLWAASSPFSEEHQREWFFVVAACLCILFIAVRIYYSLQTARFFSFSGNTIYIQLYFLRKRKTSSSELLKIEDIKFTNKIAELMMRLIISSNGKKGFYVYLRNGERYRVSPLMEGHDELREKLSHMVKDMV